MDLKDITTTDLVKELEGRKGVQMFPIVPYGGYNISIVKKYTSDRTPVQLPDVSKVLVIDQGPI